MSTTFTLLPSFKIVLTSPTGFLRLSKIASDKDLALLSALRVDVHEWLSTRHAHAQDWLPCGKCKTLVDVKDATMVAEHINDACAAVRNPSDWRLDAMTYSADALVLKWGDQRVGMLLPVDTPELVKLYLDCWQTLMAQVGTHAAPLTCLEGSLHTFIVVATGTYASPLATWEDALADFTVAAVGAFDGNHAIRWVRCEPAAAVATFWWEAHITVDVFKLAPRAKLLLRRLLYKKPSAALRPALVVPPSPRKESGGDGGGGAVCAAEKVVAAESTSATAGIASAPAPAAAPPAAATSSGV
jgi:hypothetical protein